MQADTHRTDIVALPVIVFGRDDKGKPHASRFEASDAPLAEKAAGLMGMRVLRVSSAEDEALAAQLPAGRVFASGRGFVPFVKGELFDRLAAAPGAFEPDRPLDAPEQGSDEPKGRRRGVSAAQGANDPGAPPDGPGVPPADWAGLTVGSLALAAEEGKPTIWYCAVVVADRGEDLFELKWLDEDDDYPLIVRRREHLGLFPPAVAGAPK